MALRRRRFLRICLGIGATAVAPLLPLLERCLPARVVHAIRSHRYPGPVRPLRDEEITRPGRWMG
ncbi:MAG: hypothetical protein ACYTG3_17830 [Planctomycetota bacterium]|jgi:hypothetical protein